MEVNTPKILGAQCLQRSGLHFLGLGAFAWLVNGFVKKAGVLGGGALGSAASYKCGEEKQGTNEENDGGAESCVALCHREGT